jgi:hypothetical protein
MLPPNHNGCSPSSPATKVESNNVQSTVIATKAVVVVNNATTDITAGDVIVETTGNCKPRAYLPSTENNIAGELGVVTLAVWCVYHT